MINLQQKSENKRTSSRLMFSKPKSMENPVNVSVATTSSRLLFSTRGGSSKSKDEKPVDVVGFKKAAANKCGCCKKKVGVVSFKCRCGIVYCASHRYPEVHNCSFFHFYYKVAGRMKLADANPRVVADKLQRF